MRRRVTVVSCFIDILHLRSVEYLWLLVRASIFLYSNESIGQEDLRIISALKKRGSFVKQPLRKATEYGSKHRPYNKATYYSAAVSHFVYPR